MTKPTLTRIGKITIKSLRDFITDSRFDNDVAILLNIFDFDELALEHRDTYAEPLSIPYRINRILIVEDETGTVIKGKIGVVLDY